MNKTKQTTICDTNQLIETLSKNCCIDCGSQTLKHTHYTEKGMNTKFHFTCKICGCYFTWNSLGNKKIKISGSDNSFYEVEVLQEILAFSSGVNSEQVSINNESIFNKNQQFLFRDLFCKASIKLADESCSAIRKQKIEDKKLIKCSFDAQWLNRRKSNCCWSSLIDSDTKKVMSYSYLRIATGIDKIGNEGTHKGSNKSMEGQLQENILGNLENQGYFEKKLITEICIDGDSSSNCIINKFDKSISIINDTSHKMKNTKKKGVGTLD